MFYITIRGRKGFYDGIKTSGDDYDKEDRKSFVNLKGTPDYDSDFSKGCKVTYKTRTIVRSIKMKRDSAFVNIKRAYNSREEAQAEIDSIKALCNELRVQNGWFGESDEYYNNNVGGFYNRTRRPTGGRIGTKNIKVFDDSKIEKYLDKLEIYEDTESLTPKKTLSINRALKPTYNTDVQTYRVGICDCCRITLTKDEPVVQLGRYKICNNCIQTVANELGGRYEKHPMAEDITTSWTLEMMSSR